MLRRLLDALRRHYGFPSVANSLLDGEGYFEGGVVRASIGADRRLHPTLNRRPVVLIADVGCPLPKYNYDVH